MEAYKKTVGSHKGGVMMHKAWLLYPEDCRQAILEYELLGKSRAAALDRVMREYGWHRIETNRGRVWVSDLEYMSLSIYGVSKRLCLKKPGYRHAAGEAKRQAAMKIPPTQRKLRAKKAAAARWRKVNETKN